MIDRFQRAIGRRWYRLLPSEKLIALAAAQRSPGKASILIATLKERLAHQDGSLDHLDWSAATLPGALLSACRMKGANLSAAQLRGAYFGYSDLSGADFRGADLREAHFREARLNGARFDRAKLRDANFARAVLAGSSLREADLVNANFWAADLRGANLNGALMTNCSLVAVIADETTILPNGETGADQVCWRRFTASEGFTGD